MPALVFVTIVVVKLHEGRMAHSLAPWGLPYYVIHATAHQPSTHRPDGMDPLQREDMCELIANCGAWALPKSTRGDL